MSEHVQNVQISRSDNSMDTRGFGDPVNILPVKCTTCTFPDIDFVAQPYLLARGVGSSKEFTSAQLGNFLVRERAQLILQTVIPGQLDFYPTQMAKTKEPTPWSLGVPRAKSPVVGVKPGISICPECGEPAVAHPGTQWARFVFESIAVVGNPDIFKSGQWSSARGKSLKLPWTRLNLNRGLHVSLRLYMLLKKLKVVGVVKCCAVLDEVEPTPTAADKAWVEEKLRLLSKTQSPTTTQDDSSAWFAIYLQKATPRKSKTPAAEHSDLPAAEKRLGVPLPDSYKQFISKIGSKTFKNLDENEGFDARILLPKALRDEKQLGNTRDLDDQDASVRPIMFASTGHGDCFVFDISNGLKNGEYPIRLYEHETNTYDQYAPSFPACIKRFLS